MHRSLTIHSRTGESLHWDLSFSERGTLHVDEIDASRRWPWARLGFCQCSCCTLDSAQHPTCPVADVLVQYALDLADRDSCEAVEVVVQEDDGCRLHFDSSSLQDVVGELVRLAVFQAGCPIGRHFKPLMWRMRPFPGEGQMLEALALFFALQEQWNGSNGSGDAGGRDMWMANLHEVFQCLSKRLERAGAGDVYLNAIVVMHSLSLLFSLSAGDLIRRQVAEFGFSSSRADSAAVVGSLVSGTVGM